MEDTENTTELYAIEPGRRWAFLRQMLFIAAIAVFVGAIVFGLFRAFFVVAPTCTDGKRNGDEHGVDCGGSCPNFCVAEVQAPSIKWAKAFKVADGLYHAVALITNSNAIAGTRSLAYTLTLEDGEGLIATRSGTMVLPPDGVYPVFEGRIDTGSRVPTRVRVSFDHSRSTWTALEAHRDDYSVQGSKLSGAGSSTPQLTARIQSNLYSEAENLRVVAIIYDNARVPLAVSQTVIPAIDARGSVDTTFTWTSSIAGTVRSCIVPSDIVLLLDRSGSMVADGGNPPEPLESAKRAAETFVDTLREHDRVSFVSYATTPLRETLLAHALASTTDAIDTLAVHTDGTQYTDLSAALRMARDELGSARHNADARQVIVLMTDGDVTRPVDPATGKRDVAYAEAEARKAAEEAKKQDIILYTIGFGKEFIEGADEVSRNRDLVQSIATSPEHSYLAPTAVDLAEVYDQISQGLCEDAPDIVEILVVPK